MCLLRVRSLVIQKVFKARLFCITPKLKITRLHCGSPSCVFGLSWSTDLDKEACGQDVCLSSCRALAALWCSASKTSSFLTSKYAAQDLLRLICM